MAEDGGGLLIEIGVTQARLERDLMKVLKKTSETAFKMEDYFEKANAGISNGAGRAFGGVAKGANAAAPAVKNLGGYSANLASQLNDISVQLAGGQSPFQIMLQQGTQIGQIAAQAGGGLKGLGSILAGAFASVLSPVNLLTFAVIGLGGYAVQYFAGLVSGGEDSNKVLEEQTKLIESVAKQWGDTTPAIKAYNDELVRVKEISDLIAATEIIAREQFDTVRGGIEELDLSLTDLLLELDRVGEDPKKIENLSESFETLREKVANGTATQADMKTVQESLTAVMDSGASTVVEFASSFDILSIALATAAANARQTRKDVEGIAEKFPSHGSGRTDPLLSGAGMTIQNESISLPTRGPTPENRPNVELDGTPWVSKKRSGGGRGANAYKDEVAGIRERTAALQASTAAQAAINPLLKDYGYAMEKAKAEASLLADAQRAGMDITPQLREQISSLAGSYAQASAEAKQLSEAQNDVRKRAEEWASLEKDVFGGFIKDLKSGKSGAEALGSALEKLSDKLLDMAINSAFSINPVASGGGGGFISSLLKGFGMTSGYASGTANTGGRRGQPAGVVHGQEAVIPLPAGGRVPVQISSPIVPSGKSSRDVVSINLVDDSGRMADVADQRIRTASGTIVQVAVAQSYKQVRGSMASLMTDTQQRQL